MDNAPHPVRVTRLMTYTYPDAETALRDMAGWTIPAVGTVTGRPKLKAGMTIASTVLPIEFPEMLMVEIPDPAPIADTAAPLLHELQWPVWRLTWNDYAGMRVSALTTAASESAARQAWIEGDYGAIDTRNVPEPGVGASGARTGMVDGLSAGHLLWVEQLTTDDAIAYAYERLRNEHPLNDTRDRAFDDHDPDTCQDPDCEDTHRE